MSHFLPAASITVGLYALALSIITVLVVGSVPGGLGTISGSKFGLGIRALNVVEFGIANGAAEGGKRLLFFRKVTEWGSATGVGLYQFTLWPGLILML